MAEEKTIARRKGPGWGMLGGIVTMAWLLFGLTGLIWRIAGDGSGLAGSMLRYAPPAQSGLPESLYPSLGHQMAEYLTGRREDFQFTVESAEGGSLPLFHEYELLHMADCRGLILLDGIVCQVCLTVGLGGLIPLSRGSGENRRSFARGGLGAIWVFGLLAGGMLLWALVNFEGFFVAFHRAAFRNDLWLLDPRTDLLIRLMPVELFMALGMRGLIPFLGWAALLALALWGMGKTHPSRKERK